MMQQQKELGKGHRDRLEAIADEYQSAAKKHDLMATWELHSWYNLIIDVLKSHGYNISNYESLVDYCFNSNGHGKEKSCLKEEKWRLGKYQPV